MEKDTYNEFDKFISQNRDEFDVFEPSDSVWEKIKEKQSPKEDSYKPIKKIPFVKIILNIAAAIILFVASYFFHNWKNSSSSTTDVVATADSIPQLYKEFSETEAYFISQVNLKLDEINKYAKENPELIKEIIEDFNELDAEYSNLKKDLNDNISNQAIIQAMIQNQKIKLRILENLLDELNKKLDNDSNYNMYDDYEI